MVVVLSPYSSARNAVICAACSSQCPVQHVGEPTGCRGVDCRLWQPGNLSIERFHHVPQQVHGSLARKRSPRWHVGLVNELDQCVGNIGQ